MLRADSDINVIADKERMARAIGNLIDNALKFTPQGGRVVVSAKKRRESVVVEVSDTGEGIPQADIDRVFERFFRVDKARTRRGGAGLGLSIAKHIVEAHGGSISATSRERIGSTFTISFPSSAQGQSPGHPDMRT